jgi:hypothetical protein
MARVGSRARGLRGIAGVVVISLLACAGAGGGGAGAKDNTAVTTYSLHISFP